MTQEKGIQKASLYHELNSDAMVKQLARVIPTGRGEDPEGAARGYLMTAYTTIQTNPLLSQSSAQSIKKELTTLCAMGLPVDKRGLAYLVPYRNKGVMEVQAQIGYLGLLDMCFRSGKVKSVSANCIYESEMKDVKITRVNGQIKVEHPFSFKKPDGKMVAVYATAEVEGVGTQTMVLRMDEVERLRKCSKAPDSPAWKDHYEAMAKKTAYRQLAKFLPKSVVDETRRGVPIYEPERFEDKKSKSAAEVAAQSGAKTIDVQFEDEVVNVDEETGEVTPKASDDADIESQMEFMNEEAK